MGRISRKVRFLSLETLYPVINFLAQTMRHVATGNKRTANDVSCLRMSVICCVLYADSDLYADALISYTAVHYAFFPARLIRRFSFASVDMLRQSTASSGDVDICISVW